MMKAKKVIKNIKKRSIKKSFLVSLFVCYQFFMPFIMNCGADLPYDKTGGEGEAIVSEDCGDNTFLTTDCVEEFQEDTDTGDEN